MKIRNILKELKPEPQTTQTTIEVKGQMKFLILLFLLKAEWTFQGQFMKIYAAIQNISNQSERRERRNKLIDGLALLALLCHSL